MNNKKGIIAFQGQLVMWDSQMMTALNDVKYLIENKSQIAWLQSFSGEVAKIQNQVKVLQDEYCLIKDGQLQFEEAKPQMSVVDSDRVEKPERKLLIQDGKSETEYNKKFNEIWLKKIFLPL